MHVRNKNSNTQESSSNVEKVIPIQQGTGKEVKGNNMLPEGANSFLYLKRDIIVEN